LRVFSEPVRQTAEITPPIVKAMLSRPYGALLARCGHLGRIGEVIARTGAEKYLMYADPLERSARLVGEEARVRLEERAGSEVERAVEAAMKRRAANA